VPWKVGSMRTPPTTRVRTRPAPVGPQAQYRGRHAKSFESVLGTLHLERAYYHCEKCQSGFCPRDRALGLEDFSLSPAVLRMVGSAATLVSFVESSAQLHELARVEVNAKQVERAAEALRQEIAEDECRRVEPLSDTPLLRPYIRASTELEFRCAPSN
jgi:hypothetical protein